MTVKPKLIAIPALVALAWFVPQQSLAAASGSIRGVVKDNQGNPLVGAAIMVVAEVERLSSEKIIKRASTSADGSFVATGILPGKYKVKAEASGFTPVEIAALVRPNKVTVFDSILLRRVGTLSEETELNSDPKYAARARRKTIFHVAEPASDEAKGDDATTVALTDRSPETHGFVQSYWQSGPTPFLGANFAVSQQIGNAAHFTMSGQTGYGPDAPQRFEAFTTATAGDRHKLAFALGYGRFTISRRGMREALGQFSLAATDTWQISGPVLVIYGLHVSRFSEGLAGTSVLPRLGLAVEAAPRTRLFAGMTPGSSVDVQSKLDLESGEIVFSEPTVLALTERAEPAMDRSYRLEFGGEQILSDDSSVEIMAFVDTISGHGVGLLAVPTDSSGGDPAFETQELRGRSRGVRVVYHRQISKAVDGSVGYAFGEGQSLNPNGLASPSRFFANKLFQIVSARINANFVQTGTRVSTVLRLAPNSAILAIDPFQGRISTFDPNVSVLLTQDLPELGMPGDWALLVDLRNLLDEQTSSGDDRQELIASRFHRLVRVGLSVRF